MKYFSLMSDEKKRCLNFNDNNNTNAQKSTAHHNILEKLHLVEIGSE
jgi:hypothetical protein